MENNIAEEANSNRHLLLTSIVASSSLPLWVEKFIAYREELDPRLPDKQSWQNRKSGLRLFGKQFSEIALHNLNLKLISLWLDKFTSHSQRSRRLELNKLFNYLMMQELVKLQSNPFSSADDKPRVAVKGPVAKKRKRLTVLQYKQIHEVANSYPFLQIAMDISLHTGMRRGDIVALRWDVHVTGKWLKKQIRKSHEKLGADDGVNLKWNLAKHQTLKATIDYARELSLKHWRCPWVLSRMPLRRVKGASKEHHAQVSAKMISDAFTECALACGIEGTGFHEIRALKSWLHKKAGHDQKLIQALMAHTSEGMTALYQAGHETIWHEVNLILPDDLLKYP